MSQIRAKNTKPEVILRKYLSKLGIRGYRVHYKLPGKPDIVFTKQKISAFIDGCFWHKCPDCYKEPKNNKEFWKKKINGNVKHDKKINKILKKEGWQVIRFWEHLLRKDINSVYKHLLRELKKKGYP